jgi:tight adherence protein B
MLLLIGLFAFFTIALLALALGQQLSTPRARLQARVDAIARGEYSPLQDFHGRRLLRMQNYSALPLLRGLLQRSPRAERIADDLERAAIPLRVGEYLMLRIATGLIFAVLGRFIIPAASLRFPVLALAFLLGMLVPRWVVSARIRRRRSSVEAALPDALDMIARALRTGSGLLQAVDSVIEQMGGAIADEFGRTRQEIAAGLGVEDAFKGLDERVKSKDLHIVVTAIQIQREVGGNLAEILTNVANTMRERVRVRDDMDALASRQRLTAYCISAVPAGVLLLMQVFAPEVVRPLFITNGGRTILTIAAGLVVAGFVIMRQIVASFEV